MDIEKEFGTAPHITALANAMTRSLIVCVAIVLAVPYIAALQLSVPVVKVIRTLSFNFSFVIAIVAYITYTVGKAYAGCKIVIQGPHLGVAGILGTKTIDAGDITKIKIRRGLGDFAKVTVYGDRKKVFFGLAVDDAPALATAFIEFAAASPAALCESDKALLCNASEISKATSPRLARSAAASSLSVWVPALCGTLTGFLVWKLEFLPLLLWLVLSILFPVIAHLKAETILMLGIRFSKDPLKAATKDFSRFYLLWIILSVAVYAGVGILYKLNWMSLFPR